ncbi:MAG TPA: TetR/AcrR family transcriptional regulator [Symbiobacteriaceae bacterium]|nr:TetR/AcrR family transcriptional regulator [Symbiobacteriaceae bacterium]
MKQQRSAFHSFCSFPRITLRRNWPPISCGTKSASTGAPARGSSSRRAAGAVSLAGFAGVDSPDQTHYSLSNHSTNTTLVQGGVRISNKRKRPAASREEQAAARRGQILETALRLFAAQGYDATSTRQIARTVGITEGLIFHYFPTKASLLSAVLETPHSFAGEMKALLSGAEGQPARAVLHTLATQWLATLRRESELTIVLFTVAQTHPEMAPFLQRVVQDGTGQLAQYLAGRIQAGEIRHDLPLADSARVFLGSLVAFFLGSRTLPDAQWQERAAAYVDTLVSVWLDGARK